jgi:hypothetical protein
MPRVGVAQPPCKYFLQGYCHNGDRCGFSHIIDRRDLRAKLNGQSKQRFDGTITLIISDIHHPAYIVNHDIKVPAKAFSPPLNGALTVGTRVSGTRHEHKVGHNAWRADTAVAHMWSLRLAASGG